MDTRQNSTYIDRNLPTFEPQLSQKILWSAVAAAIFIILNLPQTYAQTSILTQSDDANCPTAGAKFVHAGVFFAISYLIMKIASYQKTNGRVISDAKMIKYSFYSTLLFLVISGTDLYDITGKLIPGIANGRGCPEMKGILIHGLVFFVILLIMMNFPEC